MPPRRTRGIQKKYNHDPLAGLVDDDNSNSDPAPSTLPPTGPPSSDDDFTHSPGAAANNASASASDDDDDALPSNASDDGDVNSEPESTKPPPRTRLKPRRLRNAGAGMVQSRKSSHHIPTYPHETRVVTRVYAGPLRRYARYTALRDIMYGPEYHRIRIVWDLDNRFRDWALLPPRRRGGVTRTPWVPRGFERGEEGRGVAVWKGRRTEGGKAEEGMPAVEGLVALVGPWDAQEEVRFEMGQGRALADRTGGTVVEEGDKVGGWMFDVGGIPLAMAWAPSRGKETQVLVVAAVPFSDQEPVRNQSVPVPEKPDTEAGWLQFWRFKRRKVEGENGLAFPDNSPPQLAMVKLFAWGRPKRLEWCPVPLDAAGLCGVLAVLFGDGRARVLDVGSMDDVAETQYEQVHTPIVTLGNLNAYNVSVTCLTWVNVNRLALGHSDGSITLWSLRPPKLLKRFGTHNNYLIDICSGYPSNPFLLASVPVGGCATVTDLTLPSAESTYFPVPAINFQPHALCWSEQMQGFMALYPSSTPTTTVAFLHHRFPCQARSIITGPNAATCVSAGAAHPYVLVGSADGSVYACNALHKLFKQKGEVLKKIRVLEHEYRPAEEGSVDQDGRPVRGFVRILQGFLPEANDDPRTEKRKEVDRKKKLARKKKRGGKGAEEPVEEEEIGSRAVTHEPLTRVTNVAWNPNLEFSCWAAFSMASGLVRVMDLGID
ncbi:hypothetical protein QBC39DRAFT_382064 [Podospora conica]|nr:hypothetical protein QBC39DRAFT_382064 [Schizothecium conicum]